jgi:hypothetical protein
MYKGESSNYVDFRFGFPFNSKLLSLVLGRVHGSISLPNNFNPPSKYPINTRTHHPHYPILRPSNKMNPNFENLGTFLDLPYMDVSKGIRTQRKKKCHVHAQSVHGGA